MYYLDFSLFAPPQPNTNIADTEGIEVVWSTTAGHGSPVIPPGTFTGLQVLNTSQYIQYLGYINQANVNIDSSDAGGELDPGGQDEVRCVQRRLERYLTDNLKERKSNRWFGVLNCLQFRWFRGTGQSL